MQNRPSELESYIVFELAGTAYGLRSSLVRQLEMIEQITPVPNATQAVEGVVFSRGQVIPALNLRVRFGFPKAPYDLRTRLLVVGVDGRVVGLIVDSAREFVNIPAESIQPPPAVIANLSGEYVEGIATVGKRLIVILRMAELVKSAENTPAAAVSAEPLQGVS